MLDRTLSRISATLVLSFMVCLPAIAQIKVGQTAGFTGAVGPSVRETTEGAKLYIDATNAKGGVNGHQIELISLDDKFDPKLAKENAKKLIDQGVICLFLTRGTPQNQAILPLLADAGVPLIGPSTGAMALRNPVNPWVFNVRATYQREAERMVAYLKVVNADRIAVIQVEDSFGADVGVGIRKGMAKAQFEPVAYEAYDRAKPDFSAIIQKVIKADPHAVIFIGSGTAVVDGMKALRAAGSNAQMLTLSNNASSGFVDGLGKYAHGTIVSQVQPSARSLDVPMVREAHELAVAKGIELTPASLEGFAAAKVLVEGLRRAGPAPTRASLKNALNTFNNFNIGGIDVSFSPTDHSGVDFSDLSIIGADLVFRR